MVQANKKIPSEIQEGKMLVYTRVLKNLLSLLVICNRIQIADTSPLRKWLTAADLRQLLLNEMMNTSGDPSTRNTTIPPIRTLTSQTFGSSKDVITTTISGLGTMVNHCRRVSDYAKGA